jgi:hypothetical protein
VLRRLSGKAPKRRNIEIFLRFGNAARHDASAHKNVKLLLREPLVQWDRQVNNERSCQGFPETRD